MPETNNHTPLLCLECLTRRAVRGRCANCHGTRLVEHPELDDLAIAHLDCDAFYAAVEKRDDPALRDKPLIIGGEKRGVVATCCYIARLSGVHSAMPMFEARRRCPEAVYMRPNMAKYRAASRQVRALMFAVTPLVEPLSVDEAFLDLSGTERLHHAPPAVTLGRLLKRIEDEIGITASVGLSYNKFLAKVASDLNKPRGFSVIGEREAMDFLGNQPVGLIWGVGKSLHKKLERHGLHKIGQLRAFEKAELMARYGKIGARLYHLARAEDTRAVTTERPAKSVSSERTLEHDLYRYDDLEAVLWAQTEAVSKALKSKGLAGRTITLKLKPNRHRTLTRAITLGSPTQMSHVVFEHAKALLKREVTGRPYRLLGVGLSKLEAATGALEEDLLDPAAGRKSEAERAIDTLQSRFGPDAVKKGRSLRGKPKG
jgi:DNA polymerase-4